MPDYQDLAVRDRLSKGLLISLRASKSVISEDGWTERTADGNLSAHFEHTIVMTDRAPIPWTAACNAVPDRYRIGI